MKRFLLGLLVALMALLVPPSQAAGPSGLVVKTSSYSLDWAPAPTTEAVRGYDGLGTLLAAANTSAAASARSRSAPLQEPGSRVNSPSPSAGVAAKAVDDILPTPQVGSTKLQNLVDNLYKGTTNPNRVGNGTTMDAIRNELATGVPTGGRMHSVKGRETLNGLNNWLRRNPDASYYDRLVGQSLADELSVVLRGGG